MKLQNKFLVLLLPAGLTAASLILVLIRRSVHSVVLNELNRSASVLAAAAAQDAAPDFEARSQAKLLPLLQSLQKREGALYAAAIDSQGVVLAHTTLSEKGSHQRDAITAAALTSDGPIVNALVFRGEPVLEVSVPVWLPRQSPAKSFLPMGAAEADVQTRGGILKMGVPLSPAQEAERRILRDIFLIFVAIGGVAFGLVLWLVKGILKPITGLMDGIARIDRGRYDVKVPVETRDELGDLALSFNSMSAKLALTTVSKEYVEGILQNISDPLVVTDPRGAIETVNSAALKTLSYSAAEIVGRPLADLFKEEPTVGVIHDQEMTLKTRSGVLIPAIFSASMLTDRSGQPRGYVCIAKDITERKRGEEALLAAKAGAEAASRELEAFSYSVSHDLRAPLRGIAGFSQIVLEDSADLDDAGKENLNRVIASTKLMGTLIDDILELSRVSRTDMHRHAVDMSELAQNIVAELKEREPSRRIEIVIPNGLVANGDSHLLQIALVNLIGNAWKYTGKTPQASMEFGAAPDAKGETVFFVKDNGAGFDMAYSGKLFGAFQRLHAQSEFEGSGVGLATVQRIIRRHGGRIWAESAVGQGATFYFTL